MTNQSPQPTPVRLVTCPQPCQCACHDAERLRKLRDGIQRNATALTKAIDQVLAELRDDEERRTA